jgi:hypothetical protein
MYYIDVMLLCAIIRLAKTSIPVIEFHRSADYVALAVIE